MGEATQISKADVDNGELKCIKNCMSCNPKGCGACRQEMTGCCCNMFSLWQGSVLFVIVDLIWAISWTITSIFKVFASGSDSINEDGEITSGMSTFQRICWIIITVMNVLMLIGAICGALGLYKDSATLFRRYVQFFLGGAILKLIVGLCLIFTGTFVIIPLILALFYRWWMICVTGSQANAMERGESGQARPGPQVGNPQKDAENANEGRQTHAKRDPAAHGGNGRPARQQTA